MDKDTNIKLMVLLGHDVVGANQPLSELFALREGKCSARKTTEGHGCQKEPGPRGIVVVTQSDVVFAPLCRGCESAVREFRHHLRPWSADDLEVLDARGTKGTKEPARRLMGITRLVDGKEAETRIAKIREKRAASDALRQERDKAFNLVVSLFGNEQKTRGTLDPERKGCSVDHEGCRQQTHVFFAAGLPNKGFKVVRLCKFAHAAYIQAMNPEGEERRRSYLGRWYWHEAEARAKAEELAARQQKGPRLPDTNPFAEGWGEEGSDRPSTPRPKLDRHARKGKDRGERDDREGKPRSGGKPGSALSVKEREEMDEAMAPVSRASVAPVEQAAPQEPQRLAYRDPGDNGNGGNIPFKGLAERLAGVRAKGA